MLITVSFPLVDITQNKAWPAQIKQHWSSSALTKQMIHDLISNKRNTHVFLCASSRVRNNWGEEELIQRLEVVTGVKDVWSVHLHLLPW